MNRIAAECPNCRRAVKFQPEQAGREVRCPHCCEEMALPSPEVLLEPVAVTSLPTTIPPVRAHQMLIDPVPPPLPTIVIHTGDQRTRPKPQELFKENFASSSGGTLGVFAAIGGVALLLVLMCGGLALFNRLNREKEEDRFAAYKSVCLEQAKTALAKHGFKGKLSAQTGLSVSGETIHSEANEIVIGELQLKDGDVVTFNVEFLVATFGSEQSFKLKRIVVDHKLVFFD